MTADRVVPAKGMLDVTAAKVLLTALAVALVPFASVAGPVGPGSRCLVATDDPYDSASSPAEPREAAAELLALYMGTDEAYLAVSVQVAGFRAPPERRRVPGATAPQVGVSGPVLQAERDAAVVEGPGIEADPDQTWASEGGGSVSTGETRVGAADAAATADETHAEMPSLTAGLGSIQWSVSWTQSNGDSVSLPEVGPIAEGVYGVLAMRSGRADNFWYVTPAGSVPASGEIDEDLGVVRVLVPRSATRLDDGVGLHGIWAATSTARALVPKARDWMPNGNSDTSFLVGGACEDQLLEPCPTVVDPPGDATAVGAPAPITQPALDVVAVGADATPELIRVSARVPGVAAPPPPGFSRVGWTISWDHAGVRWAAQADRAPDGSVIFRYAATNFDEGEFPGVVAAGVATGGTLDPATGLLAIDVPRLAVGAPADGDRLRRLAAQTWAAVSARAASQYDFFDQTEMRDYRVGLACGA